MSMTMQHEVGAMTVYDLGQARRTEKREYLGGLALHRRHDRGVMNDDDPLGCAKLSHRAFQLQSLVNGSLHKLLDFRLSKRGQNTATKSSDEALGPRESYAIPLVSSAIEHFDPEDDIMRINSACLPHS